MTTNKNENQDENEVKLGPRRWLSIGEMGELINLSINEPKFNLRNILLSIPKRNWFGLILIIAAIVLRGNRDYTIKLLIRLFTVLIAGAGILGLISFPLSHLRIWGPEGMIFLKKVDYEGEPRRTFLWYYENRIRYHMIKYNRLFIWYAITRDGDWRSKAEFGLKWELFHWGTELITSLMALMIYEI